MEESREKQPSLFFSFFFAPFKKFASKVKGRLLFRDTRSMTLGWTDPIVNVVLFLDARRFDRFDGKRSKFSSRRRVFDTKRFRNGGDEGRTRVHRLSKRSLEKFQTKFSRFRLKPVFQLDRSFFHLVPAHHAVSFSLVSLLQIRNRFAGWIRPTYRSPSLSIDPFFPRTCTL